MLPVCVRVWRQSVETGWAQLEAPMAFSVGTDGAASRATPDSLAGKMKVIVLFFYSENLISVPVSCTSIVLCCFFLKLCFYFFIILTLWILQLIVIPVLEWNDVISMNLKGLHVRGGSKWTVLCFVQIDKLYTRVYILSYRFILIKRTSHKP